MNFATCRNHDVTDRMLGFPNQYNPLSFEKKKERKDIDYRDRNPRDTLRRLKDKVNEMLVFTALSVPTFAQRKVCNSRRNEPW